MILTDLLISSSYGDVLVTQYGGLCVLAPSKSLGWLRPSGHMTLEQRRHLIEIRSLHYFKLTLDNVPTSCARLEIPSSLGHSAWPCD